MATITLTLSKKSDKVNHQNEILMEFWHGRNIHQRAKTNIFVHKEYWNEETQSIIIPKWRVLNDERKLLTRELRSISECLANLMSLVQTSSQSLDKRNAPKSWLNDLIHDFHFPKVEEQQKPEKEKSFFD